jgi:hypothetical protein
LLYVVLERLQFEAMGIKLRAEKVSGAAGVREELVDGYLRGDVLVRIVGQVFAHRVVERDLARLHELENRDGRKHFVHRANAKFRGERVGSFLFAVGHAVGSGENRFAILRQQHGTGKFIGGRVFLESCAKCRHEVRLAEARQGEFRWAVDGSQFEVCYMMGRCGLDLDLEARKLIRVVFLDEARKLRRAGLIDFLEVESACLLPETKHALDFVLFGFVKVAAEFF